jgi:hypothetical protein
MVKVGQGWRDGVTRCCVDVVKYAVGRLLRLRKMIQGIAHTLNRAVNDPCAKFPGFVDDSVPNCICTFMYHIYLAKFNVAEYQAKFGSIYSLCIYIYNAIRLL